MKLNDCLFNWMQISIVYDNRPDDISARDTVSFFAEMLHIDYKVTDLFYRKDESRAEYLLKYKIGDVEYEDAFELEQAERLWQDIEGEPKYNMCNNFSD